jgi:hypothetical protein
MKLVEIRQLDAQMKMYKDKRKLPRNYAFIYAFLTHKALQEILVKLNETIYFLCHHTNVST